MVRRCRLVLAAAALALCAGVVVYRGPGRAFVRGHVGDVAAVAMLYFALGALTRLTPAWRAALVGAIAAGIELAQLIPRTAQPAVLDFALGRTFDPLDLLWYAVGLVLAVACERICPGARAQDPGASAQAPE